MACHRRGATLAELCVVLGIMSALFIIAMPRLRGARDRAAVRGAIQEADALLSFARQAAITRRAAVAVMIDSSNGAISVQSGPLVLAAQSLWGRYGVRVSSSRDSMAYDPRGLGYGAANLTIVARKARAAETLFVSRLGRARH